MQARALAVLVLVILDAAIIGAQQPPVFRAGVELVRLDVRVVDGDGRPVTDLRRDEIEVLEDGRQRPVVLFQRVQEPAAPLLAEARTVTRDISTNQGAPRGHLYVLVFDQQHITAGNEQRARQAAVRFLHSRLRPIDRVAVYALPGPGPQIDFTRDVDRVVAELTKIRGDLDRTGIGALGTISVRDAYEIVRGNQLVLRRVAQRLSAESAAADLPAATLPGLSRGIASNDPNIFDMAVKENARSIVAKQDEAGRRFLGMLSDVVRSLRGIDGRKALVLFSEGFYSDNLSRELEQVAAAAAQSYMVTYAMDLNRRDVPMTESEPVGADQFTEIQSRIQPLASLAVETDGVLVPDATNQIDAILSRIATQSHDYYIVGFEPAAQALKERGRYRRVTVRTTRTGARASTRTGYAVHEQATPADRRRSIDAALRAPFPQQGIPVEYTTYVMKGQAPGSQRVLLTVQAELPVSPPEGESYADVVFVARSTRDGRVIASGTDRIALPATTSTGATTGKGHYRVQFDAPAGEYVMRVVVREPGGAIGSADRHFAVRRLDAPVVTVSDVVLGSSTGTLPVRTEAYTEDGLSGVMELYARTADALERVEITAALVPLGSDRESPTVHAELLDVKQAGDDVSRAARIAMPLSTVPPGEYFLRVRVRDRGETLAEMERDVRVLAGRAPQPLPSSAAPARQPSDVASGDVARQLIASLRLPASLERAGALAARHQWGDVAGALPQGAAPSFEQLVLSGLSRLHRTDYAAAAHAFDAALAVQPRNADVAFLLGWAHTGAAEHTKAISAWRNAAYLNPALVPAHLALADAYLRLGQPPLAAQALRAGLTALPNSPELIEKLAAIQRN